MDKDQLSRKLAVILHADVVGSTSLVQQNETLAHERIQDSFRRFGGIITQYHGHVCELRGDALLAEFERASDAIAAALNFQTENTEFNAALEDGIQPQLRVGISLGEVVIADGTVTGAGVVLAQRVEQLAEAGGICITGAIHEAAPRHLPVSYTDLGRQQLKGFEESVLVYQVGVKTNEPISSADPATSRKMSSASRVGHMPIMAALAVLIAIIAVVLAWQSWRSEPDPGPTTTAPSSRPDTPVIAVLAFDNLSGDPNQEYVSDGISDSIINALSNFPDFLVIARQSAFSYKDKAMKVQQIADELGVHYVLQGSVQKSDGRVRVNAQLVDAIKGHQIWSQQYDRQWQDIFALQDDITQHIVANISSNEGPIAKTIWARIKQKAPADLRAYDYWQLGRAHFFLETKDDNAKARNYFQKAVEIDPNYSLGHAWLAWTYHVDVTFGWSAESKDLIEKAFYHAQKAVALDKTEADAHWVLGSVHTALGGQPEVGRAEYETALSLNPNSADLIAEYGWSLTRLGRAADGIDYIKKAMGLNPFFPDWYGEGLMHSLYVAGRYQEVIAFANRIRIRTISNYLDLAGSYAQLGQLDAAQETADKVLELKPDFSIDWWRERMFFKNPADLDQYLDGLYKAGLPEKTAPDLPDKPSIAVLPFINMSGDPEQEYFADGLAEDLITDLSKISGLFVIARNSSFSYKGEQVKVQQVAKGLGVRYVMEGSVRRVGNQVRVNAKLIDVTTGGHVWAERYDGSLDDVFSMQDKITRKIVTALAVTLNDHEQSSLFQAETKNPEAFDAFLQGWAYYVRRTPGGYQEASRHFRRAIELDPDYGRTYAALASTYWEVWERRWHKHLGFEEPIGVRRQAEQYLQIALKNPTALAHQVASEVRRQEGRHTEMVREAETAVRLDPNDPNSYMALTWALAFAGKAEDALAAIDHAMLLNPHYPAFYLYTKGFVYFMLKQYEEAGEFLERALERNPANFPVRNILISTYAHLGRIDLAKEQIALYPLPLGIDLLKFYYPFKYSEDWAHMAEGLRQAGVPEVVAKPFSPQ